MLLDKFRELNDEFEDLCTCFARDYNTSDLNNLCLIRVMEHLTDSHEALLSAIHYMEVLEGLR